MVHRNAPEHAPRPTVWVVHPADPHRQRMGGSFKIARELFFRLPMRGVDVALWGVSASSKQIDGDERRFIRVSRTDCLWDYWLHLWARCAFTRTPRGTTVQGFRVDMLLPFLLFHPSVPTVALLDQSLTYISTEFRLLRGLLTRVFRLVEAFCLRRIDRVVTDWKSADYYRKLYPWISEKLTIQSHGPVDLERFEDLPSRAEARTILGLAPDAAVVAFIGRLEAVKNLDLLLGAVRRLQRVRPKVTLLLVGRGSQMDRLRRAALEDPPIDARFLGEQPYDRIPLILSSSDVLALTSVMEGSPTVLREALASGVPVVTTDVGDVRDLIIHPSLGRVSAEDEEAFAENLAAVLEQERDADDNELFQTVSRSHSIDAFCDSLADIYRSIGEAHASPKTPPLKNDS